MEHSGGTVECEGILKVARGAHARQPPPPREEEKREKALDKKLQAHMLRLEVQRQILDQLLQGDMTLREAAAQIRAGIDQKELELLIKMAELEDESGSVEELLCRHVVRMMRHHVYPGRPGTEALLARTRAILTSSR